MLEAIGARTMEDLIGRTVPAGIRLGHPLDLPDPVGEAEALAELAELAARNRVIRSHLGMGYQACLTPGVIQRNILENPGWYTQYTPYQAEIAQGRLEALLNFQTLVADLTGLDVANASLLDEPTAAAEAMSMAQRLRDEPGRDRMFVAQTCHPQTVAVVAARAEVVPQPPARYLLELRIREACRLLAETTRPIRQSLNLPLVADSKMFYEIFEENS